MANIGDMTEKFVSRLGLDADVNAHHDAVHIMTGIGINGINELRVNVVIDGMHQAHQFDDAVDAHQALLKASLKHYKSPTVPAGESRFVNLRYCQALSHMEGLGMGEMNALFQLGREIDAKIRADMGKPFHKLTNEQVRAIDFSAYDFTRKATDIIEQHASPKNRRIDRMANNIMEQEIIRQSGLVGDDKKLTAAIRAEHAKVISPEQPAQKQSGFAAAFGARAAKAIGGLLGRNKKEISAAALKP